MLVIKADGTEEEFKPDKLRSSLRRAGAEHHEIERIIKIVEQNKTPHLTTQIIYRQAFELLRKSPKPVAAKYSLRRALFGLGPTGFPFEDFIARVFAADGYSTKTRLNLQGKCALHEVDVAGWRKDHSFIAEAKFHAQPGIKSDLQVALYSYARYLDLKAHQVCEEDTCGVVSMYIVTNTKFTRAAIDYARCAGIELLSWGYPFENSLQDRVDRLGTYPITVLNTLSQSEKAALLRAGVILCTEIVKNPEVLSQNKVAENKRGAILAEARELSRRKIS